MIKYYKILICLWVLILASCTSTKKLPFESFSLQPETEKTLLQKVSQSENDNKFTQISRFTADYTGLQESNSFKGYARIAQDSMLMMSLSATIGTEVLRMVLSPDTAMTLNRLDYTYALGTYQSSKQIIPLPYSMLEALLSYHFTSVINQDFTLSIQDKMYMMEGERNKNDYVAYMVDSNYFVRKFFYKDFTSNVSVSVLYNSFFEVDGKSFPQDIEVNIQNKTELGILKLNIKKVEFKDELSFPFSISSKYTRSY